MGESDSLEDPALLMEVMEIREELDEATTDEEVAQVKETNDGKCIYERERGIMDDHHLMG